jgi:hypothetical protein
MRMAVCAASLMPAMALGQMSTCLPEGQPGYNFSNWVIGPGEEVHVLIRYESPGPLSGFGLDVHDYQRQRHLASVASFTPTLPEWHATPARIDPEHAWLQNEYPDWILTFKDHVTDCAGLAFPQPIFNPNGPVRLAHCVVRHNGHSSSGYADFFFTTTTRDLCEGFQLADGRWGLAQEWLSIRVYISHCPVCRADVASAGQVEGPDGAYTADDIILFINWFFAANMKADVAGVGQTPGPDCELTADDTIVFLSPSPVPRAHTWAC